MAVQKYIDNEADFWKEHFVHLQHKNMVRTNAEPLRLENCHAAFDEFSASHPNAKINAEYFETYCTFEVALTAGIKLRLFIQSSIKGSLMQKKSGDYVKLCDAKFPYNPLPEIHEFLEKLPEYLKELDNFLEKKSCSERRQKLALEFIKAYAAAHIPKNQPWKIEPAESEAAAACADATTTSDSTSATEASVFTLYFPASNTKLTLTDSDFIQKINSIL